MRRSGDPSAALGDQGRPQLYDIVGKVVEIAVHVRHIITKSAVCGAPILRLNQYAAGSTGRLRPPRPLRIPPVDPFQQIAELRWRDDHRSVGGRWPDEPTALQALVSQSEVQPLPPQMSNLWVSRIRFTHYSSGSCAAWASDTIATGSGFCCKRTAAGFGRFPCDGPISGALILKS